MQLKNVFLINEQNIFIFKVIFTKKKLFPFFIISIDNIYKIYKVWWSFSFIDWDNNRYGLCFWKYTNDFSLNKKKEIYFIYLYHLMHRNSPIFKKLRIKL